MSERAKVSAVVCLAAFMAGLDLFIVNLAFPRIGQEFRGTSLATLSWVLSAYAIVYAALLVPAGRIADQTGRRRCFLLGLSLFTLASAVCAAAPSVGVLIAGRVAQAVGAGLLIPPSLGLLLTEFPPQRRQFAVAIWASAASGAAAAGPPLGGLLTQASWRLVFLVNVPVGLAALVAGLLVLRELRDDAGPRPDVLSSALLAGSVGALALAIVQGPTWGWHSIRILGLLGGAVILGLVLAYRSVRHPAPVIEGALLRVRPFALACLAALVFFLGFGALLTGAATMARPPTRFATGTAVVSMARQIGMALGVAALIAIFATTDANVDLTAVRHGWTLVLVAAAASSLVTLAIGRPVPSAAPAAASEATA
jgi:EmrB/QacA subfamily drug resistance transporter